jgi:hypothetical protein
VVLAVNPVILLMKIPVPVESAVLLLAIVGPLVAFQHTPLAETIVPPSVVTLPPLMAVVGVIEDIVVLVIVGKGLFSFLQELNR